MTCFSKISLKNEADAEAMTVLSMHSFKEKFGWDKTLLASADNNFYYYPTANNEMQDNDGKPVFENSLLGKATFDAVMEYYKGDEYMANISKMYKSLEDKEPMEKVIENVNSGKEKDYLLSLAIPTLQNEVSGEWLKEFIRDGNKLKVGKLGEGKGGQYNPESDELTMNLPKDNENKVEKYSHLVDFSHELRHFWQDKNNLMYKHRDLQEGVVMRRCLEADASAMSILAMHSFKEDNGWKEPYKNAKSGYFFSDTFNEDLIEGFEKGKNKSEATAHAFKSWFKLSESEYTSFPAQYVDIYLKDKYALAFAKSPILAENIGNENTGLKSEKFGQWLEKLKLSKNGASYISDNRFDDKNIDFLNKDENKNVDTLTNLALQIKIYEHYGASLPDAQLGIFENKLEKAKTNEEIKLLYKSKVKYYEENVGKNKNKSKIEAEINKLPTVYGESSSEKQFEKSPAKTNTKDGAFLDKRQIEAKEKINFYKTKRNSDSAKRVVTNKVLLSRKMRRC
jgi:hypothetical protein